MKTLSQDGLTGSLCALYERSGYRRYKMSKFEEYDLYARNKDFLVSENVLTFTDLDGRLMALKPDVTLSIIKNSREASGIEKVYYHENVYRASGGTLGFREIAQAGLECIGDVDEYCVCEVLSLAAKSLLEISPDSELDVSHLGLLCELLDCAKLSEPAKASAIELMGGKNIGELEKLLKSEGVGEDMRRRIIGVAQLDCEAKEASEKLKELLGGIVSEESLTLFCDTCDFLHGEFPETVKVDFSTVGDLNYYSGIFFKGYVRGVASGILSGGQYNGLMRKLKKSSRAIGFALYLDLLEPLFETGGGFDSDILLLYKNASPAEIYGAAKSLSEGGASVCVMKERPKNMKFREVYRVASGGEAVREE